MTVGATRLLEKFQCDRVAVAVALVEGKLDVSEQSHVDELLNDSIRWAAKTRIELNNKAWEHERKLLGA